MKMSSTLAFIFMQIKPSFARRLVFKRRLKVTRKWPVVFQPHSQGPLLLGPRGPPPLSLYGGRVGEDPGNEVETMASKPRLVLLSTHCVPITVEGD